MNTRFSKSLRPLGAFWPTSGVLLTAVLLRFAYLDADPYYYEWIGYITDEGRWVQHARSLALHGKIFDHTLDVHFFIAPLFQLTNYLVFESCGVGLLSARVFTAFCGSALLVLFWSSLGRALTPQALLLAMTLMAVQTDLVMLSRVAVPEMAIIFFELLIYFTILSARGSRWRMVLAGFLVLVGMGMKVFMAVFVPIFSLIILLMPRDGGMISNRAQRWKDLACFWSGLTLPIGVGVAGALSYLFWSNKLFMYREFIGAVSGLFAHFGRLPQDFFFSVLSFPILSPLSSTLNIWAVGLWFSLLAWRAGGWNKVDLQTRLLLTSSAVWFLCYFALMLSMEYFPTRYRVHILVPMAIFIAAGISLGQTLGLRKIIESLVVEGNGLSRAFWLGVVCIPTAAFLSPLAAVALMWTSADTERVSIRLACFLFMLLANLFIVQRGKRNLRTMSFLLLFPLLTSLGWMAFTIWGGASFWPTPGELPYFALLSLLICIGAAVYAASYGVQNAPRLMDLGRTVTAVAVVYFASSLVSIAPGYLHPTYSIRDTSRALGSLLADYPAIATVEGETLFNENSLRYRSLWGLGDSRPKPDILVVFLSKESNGFLDREYRRLKEYQLTVAPAYLRKVMRGGKNVRVAVFKRNGV